ncbi:MULTISPECIES: MFS transporter [Pseudomonas]|uniref:MFS transporter n=1 Tax=Pseudomonas guariconensis TaxID=1288410 RepID=UPI0020982F4B|nr:MULTISPECIES: MFS transporter [Pseudomonas]MCO7597476.1 MFS transporter [Pseudomonas guariconensis]MCU7223218.1 MFS transporter [Pseudomonas brassicacearum]
MSDLPLPPSIPNNEYPSLRRARYAQYVLGLVALLLAMDAGIVALLLEPIKLDLGLTDVQAGIANTSSYALAYGVLSVPMGLLVDRTSRVRLLILAMLLWCASLGLATFATGFWTLALAKALMGCATAASLPAALSLFGDYFAPDRRAAATTTYPLGSILGGAAAVLVGGLGFAALSNLYAADPHALAGLTPWRAVFALAAITALPVLGLILMMREPKRMEVREQGGGTWRELWMYRGFLVPLLAGVGLLTGMSTSIATWAAPALMRLYHQQPGDFAGWYAAVILGSGGVGVAASGKLVSWAQRNGGYSAIMIPAAIGALVCAPASAMGMAPGVSLFAGALTVFQLAVSVAIVVPVIAINFLIPNELRGRAFGLYIISGAIGSSLSAPSVAALSGLLGGEHMLGYAMAGVGAPMAVLAAACLAITAKASPKGNNEPPRVSWRPQLLRR